MGKTNTKMIVVKTILFIASILMFIPLLVSAQEQNSINILTISELPNGTYKGGVASLELTIKPGTGAIFIESFPLSNVDTQAVTRIATDIACSYSSTDCDSYDFFYTIRTNSGYVKGPSAGGATALLALATLEDISLPRMAMTGGISSGGLITSVGGVGEKAVAAIDQNFSLILLPALSFNVTLNDTNETPLLLSDIQTPQESLHKIYSLDEAFFLATGKALPHKAISQPPTYYTSRMKETAQILCQRTNDLFDEVQANSSKEATDYYNQSLSAGAQGDYYSQASFCYSANLRLREQIVETLSRPVLLENYNRLNESLFSFEQQIEMQDIETLSDLETYIIVRERLFEAREYLNDISLENISTSYLSLAIERYYSAVAWSSFFGLPGEPLIIDENSLEQACIKEIREVESRANYLKLTIPFALLDEMYAQLNAAYEQYNENNYPLCIFKASKAKASAHMFMNELQSESQLQEISEVKLQRVEELIAEQQQQGIFPLMGYSYYEYAKQLRDDQPYVSLLFTEYALSMTDLSKYFPKSHLSVVEKTTTSELFYIFVGILVGFALSKITLPSSSKKKKSKKK